MPFSNANAVPDPDSKVIVGPFEATVVDRFRTLGVEVQVDGQTFIIPPKYLNRTVPFTNETVYLDASGGFFIYVSKSPYAEGVFYAYSTDDDSYDPADGEYTYTAPLRPLREVTLGVALDD